MIVSQQPVRQERVYGPIDYLLTGIYACLAAFATGVSVGSLPTAWLFVSIIAVGTLFSFAVQWLIGLGAKVDTPNRMGETPLIVAVQQRSLPIVRMLLAAGADPDRSDSAAGYSARDYATRDPRAREILKMIEDKKPKGSAAASK